MGVSMKKLFLISVSIILCFFSSCKEEDLSKVLSVLYNGKAVTAEGVGMEAHAGAFIELKLKNSSEKHSISFSKIVSDKPENLKIQNAPKVLNAASEAAFKVVYEGVSASFDAQVTIEYKVGTGFSSVVTVPVKVTGQTEESKTPLELVEPAAARLDFGTVTTGTVSEVLTVSVRNLSESSFRATKIDINGSHAAVFRLESGDRESARTGVDLDFAAGETRLFDIVFAPAEAGEYYDAVFSVIWEEGSIDVSLKGLAREPNPEEVVLSVLHQETILTSGSVVSFGEIFLGASPAPTATLTLKNGSAEKPLTVNSVEVLPESGLTVSRSAFTIAAAGSETLTVTFTSEAAGAFESELTIRSDATEPEGGLFTLKLTATVIEPMPLMKLTGEGVSEDPSGNGHYILLMPDTVFTPAPVTVSREITVSNIGTATLDIKTLTLPADSGLTSDATVPFSVEPGQSAVLKLTFTPQSEETLEAVVSLTGNNKGVESETLIAVSGKIGSDLPLLPPSLSLNPVSDLNSEKYYISDDVLSLTISTASGSKGIGEFAYAIYEGAEATGTALKEGAVKADETEKNAVIVLNDLSFADKQYTITATDTDREGTVSPAAVLRFYVDKTVPAKPESVVLDSSIETVNQEGLDVTAAENLIWNWTLPANESTKPNNNIRHSEYRISDGTASDGNESWTAVSAGKTDSFAAVNGKTYTVEVRFIDEFGRLSESTVSQPVKVDRNLPEAPADLKLKDSILAVPVEDGVRTAETNLVWTWTADSSLTYRYSINGGASTTVTGGEASFTAVTDGSYTIEVKSVNHLGLESSAVSHTVTVDTTKPQTVLDNLTVTVASDKHSEEDGGIRYVDDPSAALVWTGTDGWKYRYTINEGDTNEASGSGTSFATSALGMTDDGLYTVAVYAVNELGTVSDSPQTVNVRLVTAAPQLMIENGTNSGIEVDVWNDIRSKWNGSGGLLSGMVFKVSSDGTDWETVALNTPSSDKITVTMDDAALLTALNKPGRNKSVYDYDNRYAGVNTKTVTFTATGRFGKTDAENVTVFLKDTTAPVITNPNLGTFAFGSQDNFTITIKDNSGKYDGTAQSYALTYGGYKAGYVAGTMKIPFKDASDNTAEVTLTVNAPSTENMVGNGNFSDITNTDKITDSNTSGLTFGTPTGWGFNSTHSHFASGGSGGWIMDITYYYTSGGNMMLVCGAINNGTKYGYMTLSKWSSFNNTNVEIYTTESNTAASKTLYEGVEYELSYKYKDYTISSGVNTFQNGATVSVSKRNGAGQFASADSFSIVRTPQASGTAYVKDALNQSFNSQSGRVKVNGGNISGVTVTYVYGNTAGIRYTENYCGSIITDVTFKAVSWPKVQTNGSVAY